MTKIDQSFWDAYELDSSLQEDNDLLEAESINFDSGEGPVRYWNDPSQSEGVPEFNPLEQLPIVGSAFDFVGNTIWGAAESFGVPAVADIALGGKISSTLGHQGWKDESTAGKLGYALGTGLGFISGVGLIGKGISGATKLVPGAMKYYGDDVAAGLAKIGGNITEESAKKHAPKLLKTATDGIAEGRKLALGKTTPIINWTERKVLKTNPLNDIGVRVKTQLLLKESLAKTFKISGTKLDEAVNLVMKSAGEAQGHQLGKHLTQNLINKGFGVRGATRAGDALYEASLLAAHGVVINQVSNMAADYSGLDETEWSFDSNMKRAAHGIVMGSILSQVRAIGGGKLVQIDQQSGVLPRTVSGMTHDVKLIGKALYNRFRNVKGMAPKHKQATLNTFYYQSGKNASIFAKVPGLGRTLLSKKTLTKADDEILEQGMLHFRNNLPSIVKHLGREILRDGYESASRYVAGSVAMNAEHWYHQYQNGLFGTEEYPIDQFVFDAWVGAVYMKRGKPLPGRDGSPAPKMPKYYEAVGKDVNGSEIARAEVFMELMGKDKVQLNEMAVYANMDISQSLERNLEIAQIEGNKDLAKIHQMVKESVITVEQALDVLKTDPSNKHWSEHVRDEINTIDGKIEKASGGQKEKLENQKLNLINDLKVVQIIESQAMLGLNGQIVRPMDRNAALEYVKTLKNIKIENGTVSLTVENVEAQMEKLRDSSVNRITREIENSQVEYIRDSLKELGLYAESMEASDGKLRINSSILEALGIGKGVEVGGKLQYHDSMYTLHETLKRAESAGNIRLGDFGVRFSSQEISKDLGMLDRFNNVYERYTEAMHERAFNEQGASSWRELVPSWSKDQGFFDPYILSSTPIWDAVTTAGIRAGQRYAYDVLSGKITPGDHNVERVVLQMRDWFKGKKKIAIDPQVEQSNPESVTSDMMVFMDRINSVRNILDGVSTGGVQYIEPGKLQNMMDKINNPADGIGNILMDANQFGNFKNYITKRYVNDMLLNANITHGLKEAIVGFLEVENPLGVRSGGTLNLVTSRTLREILLQGQVGVNEAMNPRDKHVSELIDLYEMKVEGPLKANLSKGNGGLIRFSEELKPAKELLEANEMIQALREAVNRTDKMALYETESYAFEVNRLGLEIDKSIQKLTEMEVLNGDKTNDSFRKSIQELSVSAGHLQIQLELYLQNRDMVGLRTLIERRQELSKVIDKLGADPLKTSKSILDYTKELDKIVTEALRERNDKLSLNDIEGVNDYISDQLDAIHLSNRSGKSKGLNTSISDSQYMTKWFKSSNLDFIETIKHKPLELIKSISNLEPAAKAFMEKISENPNIIDFNSTEFAGVKDYIDLVLKPVLESQKIKIESLADKSLGETPAERYQNFLLDSYFVIASGLATKKMPLGVFDNGALHITEGSISNWDRGINRLKASLGLANIEGGIIIAGSRIGNKNGFTSRLDRQTLNELEARLNEGAFIDISSKEILSKEDVKLIDRLNTSIVGEGRDGRPQYQPVMLDGNTMIFIHRGVTKQIAFEWANPNSGIRKKLSAIFMGVKNGEAIIEKYLSENVGLEKGKASLVNIPNTAENIKKLTVLTRLIDGPADIVQKVISKSLSPVDALAELKYMKLDSPRTGVPLNDLTLNFSKEYFKRMSVGLTDMSNPIEVFNKQMFNPDGTTTKHRKLVINDEAGLNKGWQFFDTQASSERRLVKQLMEVNNFSKTEAESKAKEMLKVFKPLAASSVNGETYLSLPEMTAQLMAKGGNPEWFIRNAKGEVVGFNVVIKPVEHQSSIDITTGEVNVFAGKTAYKYNPIVDKMMQDGKGNYILDSISFGSASKKNAKKAPGEAEFKGRNYDLPENINRKKTFFEDLADNLNVSRIKKDKPNTIIELDRESIFIKSINGIHDATMSAGFLNFLSNKSIADISKVTGSGDVVQDMLSRHSQLRTNPFAYKKIAEQIRNIGMESGDMMSKLIGIEGVLEAGGLPVFEYMAPQLDKMVNSEYLNSRNFVSSSMTAGGNNVMTAGFELSLPVRIKDSTDPSSVPVQRSFGGSGIPHHVYNKPLRELLLGRNDGLSFSFTANKALIDKFKLKNIVEVGDDIIVTHKGEVLGPHNQMFNTKVLDINGKAKKHPKFESFMKDQFQEIISQIKARNFETLGEALMFIDGQSGKLNITDGTFKDHSLNNKSKDALANTILDNGNKLFKAIHGVNVDLRTPKAGLNDWVISKIEKLLDQRKGPVSEMNKLDVLDPQDADFDLDKSSGFFGLPSNAIKDIYNVAGYLDPATRVFDKALNEILLDSPELVEDYGLRIKLLESKRPLVVRQHSIASFMNQYFAAGNKSGTLFEYGAKTTNPVFEMSVQNVNYRLSFKGGNALADAVGHTKKLIKETIDIYKESGTIDNVDLARLVWTDATHGLLKIEKSIFKGGKGTYETLDFNPTSIPEPVWNKINTVINEVLTPVGKIFDMAGLKQSFTDGTSMKMSLYDMVNQFEVVKNQIRYAGYNLESTNGKFRKMTPNELHGLTESLLSFMGVKTNSPLPGGVSNHPLIQGLQSMEAGLRRHFSSPKFNTDIGALLAGKSARTDAEISVAIKGIIKDQKKWANLEYLVHEVNQLEDSMSFMRAMGKRGTERYKGLERQRSFKVKVLNEFNYQLNSPGSAIAETRNLRPGTKFLNKNLDWGRVGQFRDGQFIQVLNPGDRFISPVRKGDQFVINYKTYRLGNQALNNQRRAMSIAFARNLSSLSKGQIAEIDGIVSRFNQKIRNARDIVDQNAPKTSDRYGLISEAQMQVLIDHVKEAVNAGGMTPDSYVKQFLYRLLSPKASTTDFDVVGYDKVSGQPSVLPHFNKNVLRERLVFSMLDRIKSNKGIDFISPETGKELYQDIIDAHKIASLKVWDKTLEGDVFRFEGTKRELNDFDILSMPDVVPRWVEKSDLNLKAKEIMMSYMTGSYALNPIELYRLTLGLGNTSMNKMPDVSTIRNRIEPLWQGREGFEVGGRGEWWVPKKSIRDRINEHSDKGRNKDMKETMQDAIDKLCR